jgi:NADP-dependent aldehyde dehydrogenase
MELNGKNLIGNQESSKGALTFTATDPSTGDDLPTVFTEATKEEVNEAVSKAVVAFKEYRTFSPEKKAAFLEAIGDELLNLGDTLVHRGMRETALPEGRLNGERMRTVNQLKMFAELVREGSWVNARIDTAIPDREPAPKPDIRQMQKALGPVGVFGASNFPLAFSVAGGDTASALAAGCPVVVKGHPLHPGTSELVGKAILKAAEKTGMPDGIFSLVQGPSVDVGMAIVTHPDITAIGFTGSFNGGKAIFNAANKRPVPIPVFAEMGSSNPVFLLPGALKERKEQIAEGLSGSVNLGVGQFCTNPGLVISEESDDTSDFLKHLEKNIAGQMGGIMLAKGIKENYTLKTQQLTEISGVSVLSHSKKTEAGVESLVFKTDASTFMSNPFLAEEVFGPSTLHVSSSHKQDLIRIAEELSGHLTATIHGTEEDLEEYAELVEVLEQKVGRLIFNGFPTGVEVCHSMHHGGPFPATTAPQTTSVGTAAIYRFTKPVCYQDFPQASLPAELQDENPLNIHRLVDGEYTRKAF